eukprot:1137303-Pelagomonas_calceolata.AAC.4
MSAPVPQCHSASSAFLKKLNFMSVPSTAISGMCISCILPSWAQLARRPPGLQGLIAWEEGRLP